MTINTRNTRALCAFTVAGLLLGCDGTLGPITELPRELSVAEGKLIEADNRFAFKLFREINLQEGDKNIFISPLSVGMALGMTYNGAAGSTQEAMQQALELQGMTLEEVNQSYQSLIELLRNLDPSVEFLLANSIWYRNTFQFVQQFIDLNREFFDAEVTPLDFSSPAASQTINNWVFDKTNGRIEDIVPSPLPADAIMYLINAIYFKGDWTYQFDKNRTQPDRFTLADGSEKMVDMMSHGEQIPVSWTFGDRVRVIDLPYGGEAYSMTIVLPETPAEITAAIDELTQANWNMWIADLGEHEVYVSLPKFTLEYELTLNDVLTALGMGIAFSPTEADFTNLYNGPVGNAFISNVKHKTFVDVNEEGTEAAAATSVEIGVTSAPPMFVVNRPFVFAIRERFSGTILFMGKIMDPTN